MKRFLSLVVVSLSLAFSSTVWAGFAAPGPDIFGFDFRFNNPGARANAMGGAFIGLADDATAAYTNPAGLTVLTKPEISFEYKWAEYTNVVFEFVPAATPSGIAQGVTEYDDRVQGPSYISFVYPKGDSTVSIYRHQLVNIDSSFLWGSLGGSQVWDAEVEVGADTLGVGIGIKIFEPLSLGLSVGFTEMSYWGYMESIRLSSGDKEYETVNGTDNEIHYTASLLLHPFENLSVGLVYRPGPDFRFRKLGYETEYVGIDSDGDGTVDFTSEIDILDFNLEHEIKIPDFYGIGVSYRVLPTLTVNLDVNYIEYSDLIEGIYDNTLSNSLKTFKVDDTIETHFGLEYVVDLPERPLALRCGYHHRPEHKFHKDPSSTTDVVQKEIFTEGEDEHLYSVGFGTLLSDNIQIDVSGSFGDFTTEFTGSLVYRFE